MATISRPNFLPPLLLPSPVAVTPAGTASKPPAARKQSKPFLKDSKVKDNRVRVRKGSKMISMEEQEKNEEEEEEDKKDKKKEKEIDPASYRNSSFHNICTKVLMEGFHEAFTEFFTLIERQREEHRAAGPAAILLSPLIDNDEKKMKRIVDGLIEAEMAKQSEDLDLVYKYQKELALHFEDTGDQWLADHFHSCCLETGRNITGDNRRKEGEAHLHVGLAYENRGKFKESLEHLHIFNDLTKKQRWHNESGESLHPIGCEHLRRVYTKMAEREESIEKSIELLVKAHQIAKESEDTYQEGVANHRLGLAYEKIGEYDKAIKSHKGYLERCRYHKDKAGTSTGYKALSRCHETLGDIENAVKYLELYVEVAEGIVSKETVMLAYCDAGVMFNSLGDYEKAVNYFSKSYELCNRLETPDRKALESIRVQYGIAQTHYKLSSFYDQIGQRSDDYGIKDLIEWKGSRRETTSKQTTESKDQS